MTKNWFILREAGTGGTGGGGGPTVVAFDHATMVPEEFRNDPTLTNIKTVQDLAKGYVHSQRMIGQKRIAVPGDNATEAQWNEFFAQVGRPDTADKYGVPNVKVDPDLKFDEAKMTHWKGIFHKAGLSPRQANQIMEAYMTSTNEQFVNGRNESQNQSAAAVNGLRTEWGTQFDANVDIAKSVIKKFGDESLAQYLESSGMGSNVALVKLLHKIGSAVLEDRDRGSAAGGGLDLNDQTRAVQEISRLKQDVEWQKVLLDARLPGHREAVERWMNLHRVAFPGKTD